MNAVPHASWAEVYDQVYETTYGALYAWLTDATLELIGALCPGMARIIDFGAGTGRLAIPLARAGHEVVAVDPCAAMLEQLRKKAEGIGVTTDCRSMAAFESAEPADLALGVFTVLLYILEKEELAASFAAVRRALRDGGRMLVDVASPVLFHGFEWDDDRMTRRVVIQPAGEGRFFYEEHVELRDSDGGSTRYEDRFTIRHWSAEEVIEVARAAGLALEREFADEFAGSGSRYFLLQAR
jgi:SAM-dependent methyltransferase